MLSWFSSKKLCSHCQQTTTHQVFEGKQTCPECEVKLMMAREGIRACPVDGHIMVKESLYHIIIDRCPSCSGVWLDANELESIKLKAQEDDNFATGLAIGIAV